MSHHETESPLRHRVVGTAGHIDHGKSALVRALTGIDPDRLGEEKRRGITIELGFADAEFAPGEIVSFVDVPGHERFVRHMVAGATGIQAVLLVVALDQGVQPQTREHLEICSLLGLRRGVVALTKKDLVDDELAQVAALEVRELLADTFLKDAPFVSVSARTGEGLDDLRSALLALDTASERSDSPAVTRLPVDRSFVLRGFGTVLTGTLSGGSLKESDELEILPGGRRARVRGLQVHREKVRVAAAGRRTAVNLQGVDCEDVPRGSTLLRPGTLEPTRRFWARVRLLPDPPRGLERGGPVRLHHGTGDYAARFRVIGRDDDGMLHAVVFVSSPLALAVGDRFVLRRPAPVDTVGGGVVVDAHPAHPRNARVVDFEANSISLEIALRIRLERAAVAGIQSTELARQLGFKQQAVDTELARLAERKDAVTAAGRWFAAASWNRLRTELPEFLTRFHRDEPLRLGLDREALRFAVCNSLPQDAWRRLLVELADNGVIELTADQVCLQGHEVVLDSGDGEEVERIDRVFRDAGLEPPEPDSAVPGAAGAALIRLMIARGTLTRIHDGKIFHSAAIRELREKLWEYAKRTPQIDVGTFKELAGLTRKHAIPLLEHFDAEKTTRRVGNVREILPPR